MPIIEFSVLAGAHVIEPLGPSSQPQVDSMFPARLFEEGDGSSILRSTCVSAAKFTTASASFVSASPTVIAGNVRKIFRIAHTGHRSLCRTSLSLHHSGSRASGE